MRPANDQDVARLVELMAEFYAESAYTLDHRHAREAFAGLLADPRHGRVWLIGRDGADVGYVVVSFAYGMEYGGLMGVVDDFFVQPEHRNLGLGSAALVAVRASCSLLGVRAMSVEVGDDNAVAQAVYRRAGFAMTARRLMTLPLAPPTHEQ